MEGGRLFHDRDAASGKARSPRVDRCTDGTSVMVVEERRWRRPLTSAVRRTLSARYGGADPLRHQNAETELNPFQGPQPVKVVEKQGDAF